ncbi:hypothetical protein ACIA5G_39750 [Amycolatopsis sp. NPDC051758]|uniref:hypothetical protein n=1 Tax=Amycolatopsis sp. NPDC051758 TaxID=3363935 RepID=UPI00379F1D24
MTFTVTGAPRGDLPRDVYSGRMLTVHVLRVWPKSPDPANTADRPRPDTMTWVEFGCEDIAYLAALRVANLHGQAGRLAEISSFDFPASSPDPEGLALALIGASLPGSSSMLSRVPPGEARSVTRAAAAEYLWNTYRLNVPDDVDRRDTSSLLLLRLARRTMLGDCYARQALVELQIEHVRTFDDTDPADALVKVTDQLCP